MPAEAKQPAAENPAPAPELAFEEPEESDELSLAEAVVEPMPTELPAEPAVVAVAIAPIRTRRPPPRVAEPKPQREREKPLKATRQAIWKAAARAEPQASRRPRSTARASQRIAAASHVSPARWQSRIVAKIARSGRRLSGSPSGTAVVAFSMDRAGRVRSARLSHSSGDAELDREAVASVRRASPLPSPPDGVPASALSMAVPVRAR